MIHYLIHLLDCLKEVDGDDVTSLVFVGISMMCCQIVPHHQEKVLEPSSHDVEELSHLIHQISHELIF